MSVVKLKSTINLYSGTPLQKIKTAANIAKDVLYQLTEFAVPGITLNEIEDLAKTLIINKKAEPLFLGYEKYPFVTCLSLNEYIVHGTPNNTELKEGDVLSIDLGVRYQGFCADNARTKIIGKDINNHDELLQITEQAFLAALEKSTVGNTTGDVGYAIQKSINSIYQDKVKKISKYKIFPNFQGHGIGLNLHEEPSVPNFGFPSSGLKLVEGMCLCIEPVVLYRKSDVEAEEYEKSGFLQFKTVDKLPSAHYENQIYISHSGPVVLTA